MSEADEKEPLPAPPGAHDVVVPDYQGVDPLRPFAGLRDKRNAARTHPRQSRATLNPGADDEFFGV